MSNLLRDNYPLLAKEWVEEKNLELGKSLTSITFGSKFKAVWKCSKCDSEYSSTVSNRTAKRATGCPYCAGKLVNHTNNLSVTHPEVSKHWNLETNLLSPEEVTAFSDKVVGFKIEECGHSWYTKIKDRVKNSKGCPVCRGKHIQIGVNDINTTHPQVAKLMFNKIDKYRFTHGSGVKVEWKCPTCSRNIGKKSIKNIVKDGVSCVICSPYTSTPEFLMGSVLNQLSIEFVSEYNTTWAKGKQYDFFLPKYNSIIETHGAQHYSDSFRFRESRTLLEEQENDRLKEEVALENGIENYIVINTSYSSINDNLDSILNNEKLNSLFDLKSIDKGSILQAHKLKKLSE